MRRFYFDKKCINKPVENEVIKNAWESKFYGLPMFQVGYKIKRCMMEFNRWNRLQESNSTTRIQKLKVEMEVMKESDGLWDWERWSNLKNQLDIAYREEEQYWNQKQGYSGRSRG